MTSRQKGGTVCRSLHLCTPNYLPVCQVAARWAVESGRVGGPVRQPGGRDHTKETCLARLLEKQSNVVHSYSRRPRFSFYWFYFSLVDTYCNLKLS